MFLNTNEMHKYRHKSLSHKYNHPNILINPFFFVFLGAGGADEEGTSVAVDGTPDCGGVINYSPDPRLAVAEVPQTLRGPRTYVWSGICGA
ncbi:hypothetical protein QJS10_CPB14g00816 [Acorus calamus]|uniref:Uncharacterized protein n=1 Tax=Acorus calamus TaxID=4465 RepID=A0AAV9DBB2_ACOCL|nr:hypothetical protein QJS10_CPB14g00816 [Acorus calamus]